MNIELARTFLEVVACGTLARAADKLNVTHSTVTMRIKALEEILRVEVLIRNRSGVVMTAAGRRFYPLAEQLTHTWQMTRRQMSLGSGFTGILSAGAVDSLWEDMMFEWARKSRREVPGMALRCESGSSGYLIERLFQGWLDFCLVHEASSRSGFITEVLFDDPLVIASTEDRPARHKWDPDYLELVWEEGVQRQQSHYWPDTAETPHLSAQSMDVALRFLMEFGGSMILPRRLVEGGRLPRPLYIVPEQPVLEQKVYLIYSEDVVRQRMPGMTVELLRLSLLNQLNGLPTLWNDPGFLRKARPNPAAKPRPL